MIRANGSLVPGPGALPAIASGIFERAPARKSSDGATSDGRAVPGREPGRVQAITGGKRPVTVLHSDKNTAILYKYVRSAPGTFKTDGGDSPGKDRRDAPLRAQPSEKVPVWWNTRSFSAGRQIAFPNGEPCGCRSGAMSRGAFGRRAVRPQNRMNVTKDSDRRNEVYRQQREPGGLSGGGADT